jgi:hypothetical protein
MKSTVLILLSFLLFTLPCAASAEPLKTYVSEFTVAGTPGKDDLKTTLQGVLASRLNPERVQLVESKDKAELLISGSYALFGRMFSVDVLIKNMGSGKITKLFEQGDSQDDLLPAMGRLALKIDKELAKIPVAATTPAAPTAPMSKTPALPRALPAPPLQKAVTAPAEGYMIRQENSTTNWSDPPLEGVFTTLALGRALPSGEREIFVAGERILRYYRQGAGLKQVAEVTIPRPAKILGIDTADLDGDGVPEIYLTIMDRETLVSQVYLPKESGLEKIADNLPFFLRGIGPDLRSRKIFVQELGATGDLVDDVAELVKSGSRFATGNRHKLPRYGAIFNFSRFTDGSGKSYDVVLNGDGYLIVSSQDGREAWRSSDKFGGSENFFKRESMSQMRATGGDQYIWTFLEQRIIVTPDGKLLVPHNEGLLSVGNNRAYSKHTLHALAWSGSVLKELWHSKQEPTYLADFAYDPASRELLLLEVIQKEGMFGKGKTQISSHKIE